MPILSSIRIIYDLNHHSSISTRTGTSSIGSYVHKHVMESAPSHGPLRITVQRSPTPDQVRTARRVVRVLDAHSPKSANAAIVQMKHLCASKQIKSLGLVVKGSEKCDNSWLIPFVSEMQNRLNITCAGKVRFVFMIYGVAKYHKYLSATSSNVPIFHWPLGVATYNV